MIPGRFLPAVAALLLMWSGSARAAKDAYVSGQGPAALLNSPSPNSQTLITLQPGAPIEISNYPTSGYYKTRTAAGQIGWIAVTSVSSTPPVSAPGSSSEQEVPAPPPEPAAPPPAAAATTPEAQPEAVPAPAAAAASPAPQPQENEQESETIPYEDVPSAEHGAYIRNQPRPSGPRIPFEIKAFGGVQQLGTTLSFSQIGATLYSSMPYFGLQFGIPVQERIYILLRLEHLSRSSSQSGYDFSLSSTPIMTGISYSFLPPGTVGSPNVRLRGSILLGVGLATTLNATATSDPAPNTSELETQAFTEMMKLDLEVPVSPGFAIFAEGGYRFMNSSSVGPSQIVNGSGIFQQGGTTVPISLDLSGFFGGGGLAFYL